MPCARVGVVVGLLGLIVGLPGATALLGCTGCKDNVVHGLRVTVLDGAGGPVLCGATVTATDGAYSETLAQSPSSPCYYYGARERTGAYSIEVSFQSRTASLSDVHVTAGECHVVENDVTITLPSALASP